MGNGIQNPWVKLLICYFLGFLGVHKFIEKKTGAGILYLCTCGLFGIGWIVDVIKYLIVAIKSLGGSQHTAEEPIRVAVNGDPAVPGKVSTKTVILWLLTGFFGLASLVYLSSGSIIAGLFGALFVALVIPIDSWQAQIKKYIKGKIKPAIAVGLAVLCFASVPSPDVPEVDPDDLASVVETHQTSPTTEATKDDALDSTTEPTQGSTLSTTPTTTPTPPTPPAGSSFRVHFIDVGQADAALVECDGHYMLIDGGNKADSNLLYSVLRKAEVPKLDIVVGTHAHEDHIGGLPGAFNYTTADLTLCPVKSYDSEAFKDFAKYADQNGGGLTVPSAGSVYSLGSAKVTILGVNGGSDTNDTSIILRIDYGETSFLFTGDAEREAEQAVLNSGKDLSATVLKVGHHGSETSTGYVFLREIMPRYAVISVGADNNYGHPTEDVLSRLRDADVTLFRTDLQGDVYCTSDGSEVTFSVEKNANADVFSGIGGNSTQTETEETNPPQTEPLETEPLQTEPPETEPPRTEPPQTEPEESPTMVWIPKSGKRYHSRSGCSNMKNPSQVTKERAIAMGYTPCSKCY